MARLADAGRTVLLETSGAIDIAPVDPRVHIILDIKTPGSGEVGANLWGNIALLKLAAQLGLVSVESAEAVSDAYRDYRRRQHWLRLNGAKYARVPAEQIRNRIDATRSLWAKVFGAD